MEAFLCGSIRFMPEAGGIDAEQVVRRDPDFLISYAQNDQRWAEWIAWQLEDVGYRTLIEAWDGVPGTHWVAGIGASATCARRVILLLSKAHVHVMRAYGVKSALDGDQDGSDRRLVPIKVEDCSVPPEISHIRSIDLFGLPAGEPPHDVARRLLAGIESALAGRGKPGREPMLPGQARSMPEPPFPTPGKPFGDMGRVVVESVAADDPARSEAFVGRGAELAKLMGLLASAGAGARSGTGARPAAVVIGPGGTGKTALVRRAAAHAVGKGWFSGGAFIVDLQGYGRHPGIGADQVYRPLLVALDRAQELPATLGEQAAVYYRMLAEQAKAGKPVLLVLDNVSHVDQIAALLTEHPAHRVLVTSRRNVFDLVDHQVVELGALAPSDAVKLLGRVLCDRDPSDQRVVQQRGAADELATLCGWWPLALRIAGTLLADSPRLAVTDLVADLADVPVPIVCPDDIVCPDNDERLLAPILTLSWERMVRHDPAAAELFWLLPVNPGAEISTEAAAALVGWQPWRASWKLRTLQRAHLVRPANAPGRWRMHDVVASYAAQRLPRPPSLPASGADARAHAFDRLLCYYQTQAADMARRAGWFLLRHSRPAAASRVPLGWEARQQALAWFTAEEPNLLGCIEYAARLDRRAVERGRGSALIARVEAVTGRPLSQLSPLSPLSRMGDAWSWRWTVGGRRRTVWHRQQMVVALIDAMAGYLRNNGPWENAAELHHLAADVAERCGDARARGIALNDLGITYRLLGHQRQAVEILADAVELFRRPDRFQRLGLPVGGSRAALLGQANALHEMGIVHNEGESYEDALKLLEEALRLYREVADEIGVANASKNLGVAVFNVGWSVGRKDPAMRDAARELLNEALRQYDTINDNLGVAEVRNHLGRLWLKSGAPDRARDEFDGARKLAVRAGSRLEEARACRGIGECQASGHDYAQAISSFEHARDGYFSVGAGKDLDDVRERLAALRGGPPLDTR